MKPPTYTANYSGALLAVLAAFCWGIGTVMAKGVLDSFTPVFLLTLQLAASVVFLWLWIFLRRIPPPNIARSLRIKAAALGLLEPWLAFFLGLVGLAVTRASNATLIQATEAIMIIIASAVLFRVKPTYGFVALSVVAVGGLLVALGVFTAGGGGAGGSFFGDGLVFLGTAAAAVYVVLSGKFARAMHPLHLVARQQVVAFVFAALLLLIPATHLQARAFADIPLSIWLLAIASGLVQYAFAFSLYLAALRTLSANHAGSFLNLIPVFGLAAAFLFLHETLSLLQLTGAMVTVLAVTAINMRVQQPQPVE